MRAVGAVALVATLGVSLPAHSAPGGAVEVHTRLVLQGANDARVALTLDACSGEFDAALIGWLIQQRIPATVFVTQRWLVRNPTGLAVLRAHPTLFQIENHGARHIPAVIGAGRKVYGLPGQPDLAHLREEVVQGAQAVQTATGSAPHWYRSAAAVYDPAALSEIEHLGYRVAGFSVNVDGGATLGPAAIVRRLQQVRPGDILLAHMNHPRSGTAAGLQAGLPALLQRGWVFVRLDEAATHTVP